MVDMARSDDEIFYEEDEPVEEVLAAFEAGEKGATARPLYEIAQPSMNKAVAHSEVSQHFLAPEVRTAAGPAQQRAAL